MKTNRVQGLAFEPPDSLHVLACPRVPLASVIHLLPKHFVEGQQTAPPHSCCRKIENLDIEAFYSQPSVIEIEGKPDIYKFHCNECTDCHVRFCASFKHPLMQKLSKELLALSRPIWGNPDG